MLSLLTASVGVDLRGHSVGEMLLPLAGFLVHFCFSSMFSQLCLLYQRCTGKHSVGLGCHLLVTNETCLSSKFNREETSPAHGMFVCVC